MTQEDIAESLRLLQEKWNVEPVICDFMLGRIKDVSDRYLQVESVVFHIPYIESMGKYVLWKCHWPDCHNCCERQGRLPLNTDDLIVIGRGLKYQKISDFIKKETHVASYDMQGPHGQHMTMTTVNLKRKKDETEDEDGTYIACRFLDHDGGCSMHPHRPGVCYMYPFMSWIEQKGEKILVHAACQVTGDCPGFYLADSVEPMKKEFEEYSKIVYDYTIKTDNAQKSGISGVLYS